MSFIASGLAFIGRYGTQGFAVSILMGLMLPQFAAAARPLLGVCVFFFLAATFARVDLTALAACLRRPGRLAFALVWSIAAPVVLISTLLAVLGRESLDPGLVLGLALMAAAPPIMSSPAVAMLLGLPPTMLLAVVLATTAFAPIYAPLAATFVAQVPVPLDASALALRMALLIGGAVVAAALLRAVMGERRIRENKSAFDGLGVVFYFLFAIAAMDGVLAAVVETPARVAAYVAIAFGVAFAGIAASMALLRPLDPADRFVLGYGAGQRNIGLLIAALGAATPQTTFLFFALAQFPIYLMPLIVKRFSRRYLPPADAGERRS